FDGIRRVRGNRTNSILAIAELVFAVLMLISIFIAFPAPLGTFVFAVALEVVLILLLVLRGTRGSGFTTLTLIALILNTVVVLIAAGWLSIPGLG
ncbi:MAG TPA: hypothetical protein PK282_09150, partial [Rhodoglobus sp.]|nr:hypothetical protein [Rhodoglobus sp.]